jgi:hypothetical protein
MKTAHCTEETVCVCRGKMNDAQYIKALEQSNKTLGSENRRLVKLRITEWGQVEKAKIKNALNCSKCLIKAN